MSQVDVNDAALDFANSQRQIYTTMVAAAIAAQERNVKFAQSIFERGIEELKSQGDTARDAVLSVTQQADEQRKAFETLAHQSVDLYMDYVHNVVSFYSKGLGAIRQATE